METSDWSRRLIRELESSGMEYDGETGLQRHSTLVQLLRRREARLERMAQFLGVALLVVFSAALALLITAVHGGRGRLPADTQAVIEPINNSSGMSTQQTQHEDFKNPRAMLTAPKGPNTVGEFLAWESDDGHAFCHGGFTYSNGSLVVPRSGIYRVFLQITYESKADVECDVDELRLKNRVVYFRDTYTHDVCLLTSVDIVSCSMEPWSKSLYTAGLFFLEANCRLRVQSTHPELIVEKEYRVFFGAELLPQ